MSNYRILTDAYYSCWTGADISQTKGVKILYSKERDVKQAGYSFSSDLYVFLQEDKIIASYGKKAADKAEELRATLSVGQSIEQIAEIIEKTYKTKPNCSVLWLFDRLKCKQTEARVLSREDFPAFKEFFIEANPQCNDLDWLEDYFFSMTEKGFCHGVFLFDKLVSVADAPDMPYMSGKIQEVGIETLKNHRNKGYAKAACTSFIESLIRRDICPLIWNDINNIASQALSAALGFKAYAKALTLAL